MEYVRSGVPSAMSVLSNQLYPDNNNISIDKKGANRAAATGDLDTLILLSSLKPPIYPDQEGANMSATAGDLETLKFLSSLKPAIYPDQEGANKAAENGQLLVLRWLENLESPIRANRKDLDFKNLDALKWYDIINFLELQEGNIAS